MSLETLQVVNGVPFAITRHLKRLTARSAHIIGFPPPSDSILRRAVDETVESNQARLGDLGRLRITLTAGRPRKPDRSRPAMIQVYPRADGRSAGAASG